MIMKGYTLSSQTEITVWKNTAGINRIKLPTVRPKTELEAHLNLSQMKENKGI
jgi:hypothetical protein